MFTELNYFLSKNNYSSSVELQLEIENYLLQFKTEEYKGPSNVLDGNTSLLGKGVGNIFEDKDEELNLRIKKLSLPNSNTNP